MTEKKKEQYVHFCPVCKAIDVEWANSDFAMAASITPRMMKCNCCGYTGYVFPEVEVSELEEFRKEAAKSGKKCQE